MQKLLAIFSLVLMLCACDMQQQPSQLAHIKAQNKIRVGTLAGASNYYQAPQGVQGFEYELAQEFADYVGVELEMVPFFNLSDMFARLESGDLDIIASGLTYNTIRAEHYRFGPTYRTISQKLVYKQGRTRPREFEDLTGNLTVLAKSSHSLALQQLKQLHPELSWNETEDMDEEELLQAVIDGEIDYTLADSHTLSLFRRYHPNLSIGFSVTRNDPIAWLLRKDGDDSLYALMVPFFGDVKKSNQLYVLEVNPRSSGTIPFLSKVTDVPMAQIATKIILGKSLKEQNIPMPRTIATPKTWHFVNGSCEVLSEAVTSWSRIDAV